MPDPLAEYRAKRHPDRTPEPAAEPVDAAAAERTGDAGDGSGGRFVVQQHDATRLHWDLRLEHGGTLPSWALPRGVPWTPDRDHLAVRTEDHPLEYLTFEGDIPGGEYGAGAMTIWDHGTHEVVSWADAKVVVVLHGERVAGRYAIFRTGGRDGRDWLIHRMDPPDDPTRRPTPDPATVTPMRPVPGPAPLGDGWAWEARWHGLRVLVVNEPGDTRIAGPDGEDLSARFPELRRVGRAIASTEVVLDGVVVDGGSGALAARLRAAPSAVRRLSRDRPVQLVLVDVLWWEGHDATPLPWIDRRALLDSLALRGPAWATPTAHVGDGRELLVAARGAGAGALVVKRVDAPYRPGEATGDWVEVAV